MSPDRFGRSDRALPDRHPSFDGHFPERPLLPGVVLLAEAIEALREAGVELPVPWRLGAVKFLAPCEPGDRLRVDWSVPASGRVTFEVVRLRGSEETPAAAGNVEAAAP